MSKVIGGKQVLEWQRKENHDFSRLEGAELEGCSLGWTLVLA